MQFIPENRDDIIRYYKHSYIKIAEFGDKLFYIDHVDNYAVKGKVEDGGDFIIYLGKDHPYLIEYILPHKSFFQFDKQAVQLTRVPAKQYHRGITPGNTMMYFKNTNGEFGQVEISFNSLKAFVNKQKFFSLAEAIKDTTKYSYVLDSRMMYDKRMSQICVDFEPVASVKGNTITMNKPLFKHELMSMLRNNNEQGAFAIGP